MQLSAAVSLYHPIVFNGAYIGRSSADIMTVEAYIANPADNSRKSAILILTDVIGHGFINAQLIADQFAANGYFVVMPDLFHGDPIPLNMPPGFDFSSWLQGHQAPNVDPTVESVLKELRASGYEKIGAVGYCFGVR
jgi:dienelactone hydrolase